MEYVDLLLISKDGENRTVIVRMPKLALTVSEVEQAARKYMKDAGKKWEVRALEKIQRFDIENITRRQRDETEI